MMLNKTRFFSLAIIPLSLCSYSMVLAAPSIAAPTIQLTIDSTQVHLEWTTTDKATGYRLYYAPYPYTGEASIEQIDLNSATRFSANLWDGASYYVAVQSYNSVSESSYSNIELIQIPNKTTTIPPNNPTNTSNDNLPTDLVLKPIQGGSFIMGNNALKGPQAGQATEHEVTLSDFEMSETEVSNLQYIEFLNAAFAQGLIEISQGTAGGDKGKSLIVGSSQSTYAGKVLYDLSGTRVMKDHDNQDGDNDPFTGQIEPENPLNIAYIGFDDSKQEFYLKNPHSSQDFNWYELCNYSDYSNQTHQLDNAVVHNDFDNWPELKGWTLDNPKQANALPTHDQVGQYPATFIRWWGAKAFADFYGLKLPTEAQWEYAAKAGSQNFVYAVYDGETIADANWNSQGQHPATHHVREVKSGASNPFGLYNLGGNVWEWMADNYQAYSSSSANDPLIEISGSTSRSWRGGSWNYHQATLESSARYFDDENRGNDHFGFRVVR